MPNGKTRPLVLERRGSDPCAHCGARSYSVCNAIEDRDLERLASLSVQLTVEPGRCFIEEGDPAEHFFNVTAGTAKLFKLLPDGRRAITGFAGPGHFLGLAVSTTYAFSAEAVDAMRVCRFSRSRLRLLLGRKTARERLASFLIARAVAPARCLGRDAEATESIDLPMTRGDVADYLGLTIETVSRTLTRLRGDGLIEIPTPAHIVIRRHADLESIATGMD
jgi:CRP/FNR family transcriptional regulator